MLMTVASIGEYRAQASTSDFGFKVMTGEISRTGERIVWEERAQNSMPWTTTGE
jgi:hypothetical protein